jgi:hypothetical protein
MYGNGRGWTTFQGADKAKSDGGTEGVAVDCQVRRGEAFGGKSKCGSIVGSKADLSGRCC